MTDPKKIENAIRRVRNQKSFIQELLIDALGWDIDEPAEEVEDIAFEWSAEELPVGVNSLAGSIRLGNPKRCNHCGTRSGVRNADVAVCPSHALRDPGLWGLATSRLQAFSNRFSQAVDLQSGRSVQWYLANRSLQCEEV